MGNDGSLPHRKEYDSQDFEVVNEMTDYQDMAFSIILNQRTGEKFKRGIYTFVEDQQFHANKKQIQFRETLKDPNLSDQLKFELLQKQELCSTRRQIQSISQYFENSLKLEIVNRKGKNEVFSEGEVWYVLQTVISALQYLQERQTSHCDLNPNTLMITKNGQMKVLISPFLNVMFKHYHDIKDVHRTQDIYLCPQLLYCLGKGVQKPRVDIYKSDIFALGLSLLELMTLADLTNIYDFSLFTIQNHVLDSYINEASRFFSDELVNTVKGMLVIYQEERFNINQLFNSVIKSETREHFSHYIGDYRDRRDSKQRPFQTPSTLSSTDIQHIKETLINISPVRLNTSSQKTSQPENQSAKHPPDYDNRPQLIKLQRVPFVNENPTFPAQPTPTNQRPISFVNQQFPPTYSPPQQFIQPSLPNSYYQIYSNPQFQPLIHPNNSNLSNNITHRSPDPHNQNNELGNFPISQSVNLMPVVHQNFPTQTPTRNDKYIDEKLVEYKQRSQHVNQILYLVKNNR